MMKIDVKCGNTYIYGVANAGKTPFSMCLPTGVYNDFVMIYFDRLKAEFNSKRFLQVLSNEYKYVRLRKILGL